MERLAIEHLKGIEELKDFYCGVSKMDEFIHGGLDASLYNDYCKAYTVKNEAGIVVAFFALSFDSLQLDVDDIEDLRNGWADTSTPQPTPEYFRTFWSKVHYPALEIAYLAVSKQYQKQHIGTQILEAIDEMARRQQFAGCQFLTVGAYVSNEYSAVEFYSRNYFAKLSPVPIHDTLRMYHNLLTN